MGSATATPFADDGPEAKAYIAARAGLKLKPLEQRQLAVIRYREQMARRAEQPPTPPEAA